MATAPYNHGRWHTSPDTSPQVKPPVSRTLEPAGSLASGRTLGQEEQISNLIAFLTAIDAAPLAAALRLGTSAATVTRERALPRRSGRAGLLVHKPGVPAALIEVKASADRHGEQFARHDEWAKAQEPAVRRFLAEITSDHDGVPAGWRTDTATGRHPCDASPTAAPPPERSPTVICYGQAIGVEDRRVPPRLPGPRPAARNGQPERLPAAFRFADSAGFAARGWPAEVRSTGSAQASTPAPCTSWILSVSPIASSPSVSPPRGPPVLGGSMSAGRATATSDLDIVVVVVVDGPPAPFRETIRADGVPVELFVHTEEATGSIPVSPTTKTQVRGRGPARGHRPFIS